MEYDPLTNVTCSDQYDSQTSRCSHVNINDQYFSGFYINNDGRNCEQCPIEEGIDIDNTEYRVYSTCILDSSNVPEKTYATSCKPGYLKGTPRTEHIQNLRDLVGNAATDAYGSCDICDPGIGINNRYSGVNDDLNSPYLCLTNQSGRPDGEFNVLFTQRTESGTIIYDNITSKDICETDSIKYKSITDENGIINSNSKQYKMLDG